MKDNNDDVPTMDELRARIPECNPDYPLEKDAETLAKLIGKKVIHLTSKWDEERKTFRKFYEIREISSVELECEPHKAIILRFVNGDPLMFMNLDQFDDYSCKVDGYGSIHEYLASNGFSLLR
jgi:hypothetical protein